MNEKNIKIFSGNAEVIRTGIFTPLEEGKVTLSFKVLDDTLTLIMECISDKKNTDSRWEANFKDEDPSKIHLKLINVDAKLGGGSKEPMTLWSSDEYKIFLQLRILNFLGSPVPYMYTFYMKKKEENDG